MDASCTCGPSGSSFQSLAGIATSPSECQALCESQSWCVAVDWYEMSNTCVGWSSTDCDIVYHHTADCYRMVPADFNFYDEEWGAYTFNNYVSSPNGIQISSHTACVDACSAEPSCIGYWSTDGSPRKCVLGTSVDTFNPDMSKVMRGGLRIADSDLCCLKWSVNDGSCFGSSQGTAPYGVITTFNVDAFTDLGDGCIMETTKSGYYSGTLIGGSERSDLTSEQDCRAACCN